MKRDAVLSLGGDGGVRNRGTIEEIVFFSLFLLVEDGTKALRVSWPPGDDIDNGDGVSETARDDDIEILGGLV